jgi:hypothetical protein
MADERTPNLFLLATGELRGLAKFSARMRVILSRRARVEFRKYRDTVSTLSDAFARPEPVSISIPRWQPASVMMMLVAVALVIAMGVAATHSIMEARGKARPELRNASYSPPAP